jgi:hypothetical protein
MLGDIAQRHPTGGGSGHDVHSSFTGRGRRHEFDKGNRRTLTGCVPRHTLSLLIV